MNSQFQYRIRGLAYWLECLNPLRNTITIKSLPGDLRLLSYKRDGVGRGLYRRKIHEPGLTKLLLTRYAEKSTRNFIDVGANIGYFTCLMARLAGPARVCVDSGTGTAEFRAPPSQLENERSEQC